MHRSLRTFTSHSQSSSNSQWRLGTLVKHVETLPCVDRKKAVNGLMHMITPPSRRLIENAKTTWNATETNVPFSQYESRVIKECLTSELYTQFRERHGYGKLNEELTVKEKDCVEVSMDEWD